ncbi:ankyrin repeat domain-containing protein [bacterium]|nr:ankyrin repeat domain-containing protein [bacterium]
MGNIEAGKQHLATESDVNVKNKFGSTPMHKAGAFGQKEVVELLIAAAAAADVNAKNDDGVTPLVTAIMHKQTEITDLLRKHGGKTKKELETTVN